MVYTKIFQRFKRALNAKLFNLNFYPLEVVDRVIKWVKIIQIWQNAGKLFSNLAGWCGVNKYGANKKWEPEYMRHRWLKG